MTDILIRDVPDEVLVAIDAKAKRVGLSRTEYLRRTLERERVSDAGPVTVDQLIEMRKPLDGRKLGVSLGLDSAVHAIGTALAAGRASPREVAGRARAVARGRQRRPRDAVGSVPWHRWPRRYVPASTSKIGRIAAKLLS